MASQNDVNSLVASCEEISDYFSEGPDPMRPEAWSVWASEVAESIYLMTEAIKSLGETAHHHSVREAIFLLSGPLETKRVDNQMGVE